MRRSYMHKPIVLKSWLYEILALKQFMYFIDMIVRRNCGNLIISIHLHVICRDFNQELKTEKGKLNNRYKYTASNISQDLSCDGIEYCL